MRQGRGGRAKWYLGGFAILLGAALLLATVVESDNPAAGRGAAGDSFATAQATASTPAPGLTSGAPAPRYVFPVTGGASYEKTHHDYPATDIIAPCGALVLAVTDGVVLEVSRTDTYDEGTDDGAARGGLFVSVLGDDGVRYYGSHLRGIDTGIERGVTVRAGQRLGTVGDSGHAGVCHLHFGISPPCARVGDWWIRRGTIWPASYLDKWRSEVATSPASEVATWNRANGCPGAPS